MKQEKKFLPQEEMIESKYIWLDGKYVLLGDYHESVPEPLPLRHKGYKLSVRIKFANIIKFFKKLFVK